MNKRNRAWAIFTVLALTYPTVAGCESCNATRPNEDTKTVGSASASAAVSGHAMASASADTEGWQPEPLTDPEPPTQAPVEAVGRCPKEMVLVRNRVCVDRWESHLVDKKTGQKLSPYYPPDRRIAVRIRDQWEKERLTTGGPKARAMPLPPLPEFQASNDVEPMAVSASGVTPNGYVTGVNAKRACENAGKRLCTYAEWSTACRGESNRPYPYGDEYRPGKCNIFRAKHPAMELHDNPSIGHLDPRLNLVTDAGDPLLRKTGDTKDCFSVWGTDRVWDMNGNLDEWVDDPKGRFVGGFFSRGKKDGCQSSVTAHGNTYFDYSTGIRCCRDPG